MMLPKPDPAGPGQESVWNYPRPAVAEPTGAHIVIEHGGLRIVDTRNAVRVLETSHPPNYYLPPADIAEGVLRRARGSSMCEWKGSARYWDVVVGDEVLPCIGWSYPNPPPALLFSPISSPSMPHRSILALSMAKRWFNNRENSTAGG